MLLFQFFYSMPKFPLKYFHKAPRALSSRFHRTCFLVAPLCLYLRLPVLSAVNPNLVNCGYLFMSFSKLLMLSFIGSLCKFTHVVICVVVAVRIYSSTSCTNRYFRSAACSLFPLACICLICASISLLLSFSFSAFLCDSLHISFHISSCFSHIMFITTDGVGHCLLLFFPSMLQKPLHLVVQNPRKNSPHPICLCDFKISLCMTFSSSLSAPVIAFCTTIIKSFTCSEFMFVCPRYSVNLSITLSLNCLERLFLHCNKCAKVSSCPQYLHLLSAYAPLTSFLWRVSNWSFTSLQTVSSDSCVILMQVFSISQSTSFSVLVFHPYFSFIYVLNLGSIACSLTLAKYFPVNGLLIRYISARASGSIGVFLFVLPPVFFSFLFSACLSAITLYLAGIGNSSTALSSSWCPQTHMYCASIPSFCISRKFPQ